MVDRPTHALSGQLAMDLFKRASCVQAINGHRLQKSDSDTQDLKSVSYLSTQTGENQVVTQQEIEFWLWEAAIIIHSLPFRIVLAEYT